MIDTVKDGLTQKVMSSLCNVSNTTISRYISEKGYLPVDSTVQKNQRFPIESSRKIISDITRLKKKKVLKKKFVFYNFKGGVGKTSICFQISSNLALMGYNVLVIDADPQAHLSTSLGFNSDSNYLTLYDLLKLEVNFTDVKKTIFPGFDCVPSNLSLTRLEDELAKEKENKLSRLANYFSAIEDDYDFIFVDTNPTISLLNRNVVIFADVINIICETQPYSLNGLKLLLEDLDRFYNHENITHKDINIIPNKYEDRSSSSAEAMTALRLYYKDYIKEDFAIRKSEDINRSATLGKPLTLFAKTNSIALADTIELLYFYLEKYTVSIRK